MPISGCHSAGRRGRRPSAAPGRHRHQYRYPHPARPGRLWDTAARFRAAALGGTPLCRLQVPARRAGQPPAPRSHLWGTASARSRVWAIPTLPLREEPRGCGPGRFPSSISAVKIKIKTNKRLRDAPRGSQRRTKPGSALPGGGGPRGWGRGQNGKAQKTNGTAPHPRSARPGPEGRRQQREGGAALPQRPPREAAPGGR